MYFWRKYLTYKSDLHSYCAIFCFLVCGLTCYATICQDFRTKYTLELGNRFDFLQTFCLKLFSTHEELGEMS